MTLNELRLADKSTKAYEYIKSNMAFRNCELVEFKKENINWKNFLVVIMKGIKTDNISSMRIAGKTSILDDIINLYNTENETQAKVIDDAL